MGAGSMGYRLRAVGVAVEVSCQADPLDSRSDSSDQHGRACALRDCEGDVHLETVVAGNGGDEVE